jgi:Sugar-transfer associated ATP-grasp
MKCLKKPLWTLRRSCCAVHDDEKDATNKSVPLMSRALDISAIGIRERIIREQRIIRREDAFANVVNYYLGYFKKITSMVVNEFRSTAKLSFLHSIRAWRLGFTRFNYRMYGLVQSGNPADYISDYESVRQMRINGMFADTLKNKLFFSLFMKHHGMPTPAIYGIIRKGRFSLMDAPEVMEPARFLKEFCKSEEQMVLKPLRGWHGFGFMKVAQNDQGYLMNGMAIPVSDLVSIISKLDNYLAVEFVRQGEYGEQLYPSTTNTIRVLTFWDAERSAPFIACVSQRIGTFRSYPVDNFIGGCGGLSASVDPDSGELGSAAMVDAEGHVTWHSEHPETQARIKGVVIPSWIEIRRDILTYAGRFAFSPCIAWDIVPTYSGFSIIEGNPFPGMPVMQVHGPILTNLRIRNFYRNHGVIKR